MIETALGRAIYQAIKEKEDYKEKKMVENATKLAKEKLDKTTGNEFLETALYGPKRTTRENEESSCSADNENVEADETEKTGNDMDHISKNDDDIDNQEDFYNNALPLLQQIARSVSALEERLERQQ
ncbi:hypothetical protein PHYBLDRAFT_139508 [Phycomyces blakesleeanus NRRL 1555(-)]|uniref:Uncharacterized protein n=1 Tax=Phycomyces blakesleeanus (strain ATCC 8743b / DSM 1359 / FGSC 10004 / NBRC 33097 / NRRL 1555) TaxID=763407 RepID=A0A162V290_PHYB8|nr:hypothetical protein PHYBLDRAFT_139508 [Phycomyces blakesleeanus NRRL 1555(-)]OAD79473.1 hypothetical protein PHYBLDRAFT_139508 [Phycomyces blakesleeanus NRRL 1555(-)]|eukprot:XP_018297513.1 hypothetical protein PHYBLDRAFT_139508 [Phycomyces blakesleeanus NRRL 1555(-)]